MKPSRPMPQQSHGATRPSFSPVAWNRSRHRQRKVVAVDSIEWIASPIGENDGTVFTTVDTSPVLQVRVPAAYRPEIDAVVDITATLSLDGFS